MILRSAARQRGQIINQTTAEKRLHKILDKSAELVGFMRLALANHFGVCFKEAEQFPSAWVLPRNTRSRVWRSTCWTRGII